MELLILLIEERGQLVSRSQIIERIWGKDVFLDTDNSINAAIRKIRQVLKDDPEQPRFVQTITGRGYRFIAARSRDQEKGVESKPDIWTQRNPFRFLGEGGRAGSRNSFLESSGPTNRILGAGEGSGCGETTLAAAGRVAGDDHGPGRDRQNASGGGVGESSGRAISRRHVFCAAVVAERSGLDRFGDRSDVGDPGGGEAVAAGDTEEEFAGFRGARRCCSCWTISST